MEWKKLILTWMLSFCNLFRFLMPMKENRVTFISITADELDQDFLAIDRLLRKNDTLEIRYNLIVFKKTLKDDFMYMLNCIKQLYEINTSKLIILNDNNFVVTKFKREGSVVLQTWHACGAIKKFGNQIQRQYPIKGYDLVLANSPYWIPAYSEAFGVHKQQIAVTGMPRVDTLCNYEEVKKLRRKFFQRHSSLKGKYIVVYAPTFRGNIIKGLRYDTLDVEHIAASLPSNYMLIYKMHPLLHDVSLGKHERLMNANDMDLHMLLSACDCLITDYSSILFDYSLLHKKAICYASDYEEYANTIGFNVDYLHEMPSDVCSNEEELIANIIDINYDRERMKAFQEKFMPYKDGNNAQRVVEEIYKRI